MYPALERQDLERDPRAGAAHIGKPPYLIVHDIGAADLLPERGFTDYGSYRRAALAHDALLAGGAHLGKPVKGARFGHVRI